MFRISVHLHKKSAAYAYVKDRNVIKVKQFSEVLKLVFKVPNSFLQENTRRNHVILICSILNTVM